MSGRGDTKPRPRPSALDFKGTTVIRRRSKLPAIHGDLRPGVSKTPQPSTAASAASRQRKALSPEPSGTSARGSLLPSIVALESSINRPPSGRASESSVGAPSARTLTKAPSIAVSNRSQARLAVVSVGDVARDDRDQLDGSDKRLRRMVYDTIRSTHSEFTRGRGTIVPLAVAPTVPVRSAKVGKLTVLDFSQLELPAMRKLLAVTRPRVGARARDPDALLSAAEKHKSGKSGKRTEGSPTAGGAKGASPGASSASGQNTLLYFGDDAAAVASSAGQATADANGAGGGNAAPPGGNAAQSGGFRPGIAKMWGPRGDSNLIIIRERDATYVIDKKDMDDSSDPDEGYSDTDALDDAQGLPPAAGAEAKATARSRAKGLAADVAHVDPNGQQAIETYLNFLQLEMADLASDAPQIVYILEREVKLYLLEIALRRIVNYTGKNTGNSANPHGGGESGSNDGPVLIALAPGSGNHPTPHPIPVLLPTAAPLLALQQAAKLPHATRFTGSHFKYTGNKVPLFNVVAFARTLHFLTLPPKLAVHAAFVSPKYTQALIQASSPANNALRGRLLPLNYLTILDLSECGMRAIEFPVEPTASNTNSGHSKTGQSNRRKSNLQSTSTTPSSSGLPTLFLTETEQPGHGRDAGRRSTTAGGFSSMSAPKIRVSFMTRAPDAPQTAAESKAEALLRATSPKPPKGGVKGSAHSAPRGPMVLTHIPDPPGDLRRVAEAFRRHGPESAAEEACKLHAAWRRERRATNGQHWNARIRSSVAVPGSTANFGGEDSMTELARSSSRAHMPLSNLPVADAVNEHLFDGYNANFPMQHWTIAPCAPLRFLTTLYLHGNDLQCYRQVLTFAALAKDTLATLTFHGNPAIDAVGTEATAAAQLVLPRLLNLNFTSLAGGR